MGIFTSAPDQPQFFLLPVAKIISENVSTHPGLPHLNPGDATAWLAPLLLTDVSHPLPLGASLPLLP